MPWRKCNKLQPQLTVGPPHRRSYIGVTAHWIDNEMPDRMSAVLASNPHWVWNCLKDCQDHNWQWVELWAFSVFAVNPEQPEPEETEEDESTFHDVYGDLTEAAASFEYQLPHHQRCAAHTINLISTVDAEKAENDPTYKRLTKGTFAKWLALWNKASRSTQAADVVQEECSLVLLKPNATHWNSMLHGCWTTKPHCQDKGWKCHSQTLCGTKRLGQLKLLTLSKKSVVSFFWSPMRHTGIPCFMAVERLNHIAKTKGENAIHKLFAEFNVSK